MSGDSDMIGHRDPSDIARSRRAIADAMRHILNLLDADDDRFIELSTMVTAERPAIPQRLVWHSRTEDTSFVHSRRQPIDLSEVSERFPRAVLLGDPGSGKSTCLRDIARRQLDRIDNGDSSGVDPLPVYVSLAEWNDTAVPAANFLRSRLASLVDPSNFHVREFDTAVAEGQFLFLLDGLNELPGRRTSAAEGRHERDDTDPITADLTRAFPADIDSRERSLREFAASLGARCRFTLACRSQEYFDSLQWTAVQLVAIDDEQLDQFIDACLQPDDARDLKTAMRNSSVLRDIANNPFFLQCIAGTYRPGFVPTSRGEILSALVEALLDRARGRAGSDGPGPSRAEAIAVAGRVALTMLSRGRIGSQAAIEANAQERRAIDSLTETGLVICRGSGRYFRHQIVQEYLAASALRDDARRRSLTRLLTDRRYAETISFWFDLDPGRTERRLVSALRARNLPWRRPRSAPTGGPLGAFDLIITTTLVVLGLTYLFDMVTGPVRALAFPLGLPVPPWQIVVGLWLVRFVWRPLQYHEVIISNAAYVLCRSGRPDRIVDVIQTFRRISTASSRSDVAISLGHAGSAAVAPAKTGATSSHWRVRAGSATALGEIVRRDPHNQFATDALIELSMVGDPSIAAPLVRGLAWCHDDRVPAAVARLLSDSPPHHSDGYQIGNGIAAFGHHQRQASELIGFAAADAIADEFDRLMRSHQSLRTRANAARAMGVLALPGCERRLASLAADTEQSELVRESAVDALGRAGTLQAMSTLVRLADEHTILRSAVRDALETAAGAATDVTGLRSAMTSRLTWVRVGVARALGRVGNDEALELLNDLARDDDPHIRRAAVIGLGRANRAEALPVLRRLARDAEPSVRADAVSAMVTAYPDLAPGELAMLASDAEYPDRAAVVKRLGRFDRPDIDDVLDRLAVDPDRAVRHAARTARPSRVAWLPRHPIRAAVARVNGLLSLDALWLLWRQERLAHSDRFDAFNRVAERVRTDAELARHFSRITKIIGWALMLSLIATLAIGLALARLSLIGLAFLVDHWVVPVTAVAILVIDPIVNRSSGRSSPMSKFAGVVLRILRLIWVPIVVVGLIGGLVWAWWLVVPVILAIWSWRAYRAHRRRRQQPVIGTRPASARP